MVQVNICLGAFFVVKGDRPYPHCLCPVQLGAFMTNENRLVGSHT